MGSTMATTSIRPSMARGRHWCLRARRSGTLRSASSSSRNAATRARGTFRRSVKASAMASSGTRSSFTRISMNDPAPCSTRSRTRRS